MRMLNSSICTFCARTSSWRRAASSLDARFKRSASRFKIDSTWVRLIEARMPRRVVRPFHQASLLLPLFRICMGHAGYERRLLPGSTGPGAFPSPGRHQVWSGLHGHPRRHGSDEVSVYRSRTSFFFLGFQKAIILGKWDMLDFCKLVLHWRITYIDVLLNIAATLILLITGCW